QMRFEELGQALGYRTLRTFNKSLPTDGVWLTQSDNAGIGILPVVALEVIVTEGVKQMRGSIATLAEVSAALGVLLFQDDEVGRGLIRRGHSAAEAELLIARRLTWLRDEAHRKSQRIAVWTFGELVNRHRLVCRGASARAA